MNSEMKEGYSQPEKEAVRRIVESSENDIVSYAEIRQILIDTAADCQVESINADNVFSLLLDKGVQVGRTKLDTQKQYVNFIAWRGSREALMSRIREFTQSQAKTNDAWIDLWFCRSENVDSYES